MKIFRTTITFKGEGNIYNMHTIEHDGKYWLVPQWLEAPSEGWKIPERIVLLDSFPHQVTIGSPISDFCINGPVPKDLFYGPIQKGSKSDAVVIERPDIRIPIQKGLH